MSDIDLQEDVEFIDNRLIAVEQDVEEILSRLKILEDKIKNG